MFKSYLFARLVCPLRHNHNVSSLFQDLLQLQYEGVAVMEMFGKTKINVNLLIFLINKKFYSSARK